MSEHYGDYNQDNEDDSMGAWYDDVIETGKDIVSDVYEGGKEMVAETFSDTTQAAKDKIAEEKKRAQDKLDDSLDFEKRAKAEFNSKFNAELKRASNDLTVSLVGLFTDAEIQQKVKQGTIVLGKDGKVVRDVRTGKVLSLVEYKKQQRSQTGGLMAAVAAMFAQYRDNPSFRNQHNANLRRTIDKATGAQKSRLIADYKKLQDWLIVNPSANPNARTAEQLKRLESIKTFFAAAMAAGIEKFKANPRLYQAWINETQYKINVARRMADNTRIARLTKQLRDMDAAVKTTGAIPTFLENLARQNAEDIAVSGGQQVLNNAFSSLRDNTGGIGVALLVGGALWYLLSPVK